MGLQSGKLYAIPLAPSFLADMVYMDPFVVLSQGRSVNSAGGD